MMGRTHVAIGTCVGMSACALTMPAFEESAILIGTAIASSKLPDQLEVFGLSHRGPTHWLLTALILIAAVATSVGLQTELAPYLAPIVGGFTIGYVMHILADCCTISGVRLLGPFSRRACWLVPRRLRAVTGGAQDRCTGLLAGLAAVGLLVLMLGPNQTSTVAASESCDRPSKPVRVTLSKAKHPNIISHLRESWREGYPRRPRINTTGADHRRDLLLDRYERNHPQPVGDGLDLDEAPAAVLRRRALGASVRPVPQGENRSAGAILGNSIRGVCNGVRITYVFAA